MEMLEFTQQTRWKQLFEKYTEARKQPKGTPYEKTLSIDVMTLHLHSPMKQLVNIADPHYDWVRNIFLTPPFISWTQNGKKYHKNKTKQKILFNNN